MVRKADDQMLTKAKRVEFVRVTNKTKQKNEIQNKAKKNTYQLGFPQSMTKVWRNHTGVENHNISPSPQ